ncbi:Alpha/Beta hydrolase protein [Hypoxylon sp. FL1150]|nr:Alpha/Beta hydrolase protein [Hypoxylon sp. FL1150]
MYVRYLEAGQAEFIASRRGCLRCPRSWKSLESTTGPVLIALHGGPGAGHEYLSPLGDLYTGPWKISTKNGDEGFWSFNLFIRELDNLIDHLHLRGRGFYLLGQSWGGVLGATYAMRHPDAPGLKKLVIAGGPASIPLYLEGLKSLLAKLPADIRETLEDCDRRGDHHSEEFQKAAKVFGKNFVCSLDPLPEEVQAGYRNLKEDPTVYLTIQGPAEFVIVGSIRGWEGWKEAHKIKVETLLLNGKNDEVTNLAMYPWFKTIPKVRWVTFEKASHQAHWEDRERYMQEVGDFLASTDPHERNP